jgi:hypothetical protein
MPTHSPKRATDVEGDVLRAGTEHGSCRGGGFRAGGRTLCREAKLSGLSRVFGVALILMESGEPGKAVLREYRSSARPKAPGVIAILSNMDKKPADK